MTIFIIGTRATTDRYITCETRYEAAKVEHICVLCFVIGSKLEVSEGKVFGTITHTAWEFADNIYYYSASVSSSELLETVPTSNISPLSGNRIRNSEPSPGTDLTSIRP